MDNLLTSTAGSPSRDAESLWTACVDLLHRGGALSPGTFALLSSARPAGYADVRFDHSPHEDQPCERCHPAAKVSRRASDSILPAMKACVGCHDGATAPAECATCHEATRKEAAPPTHTSLWSKAHGDASRTTESCSWCHAKDACQDCHRDRRPASHTATWKNSGHGLQASHDREPCAACHRADECSRCHSTRPPSHFAPRFVNLASSDPAAQGHARLVEQRGDRSCRVCHERSFCLNCHPAGY